MSSLLSFPVSLSAHFVCPEWLLDGFWRQRQFDAKNELAGMLGNFKKGCFIITSGLWLSWVMAPLGPWSLERGRGGLAGNWSRLALEARWRIEIESSAGDY